MRNRNVPVPWAGLVAAVLAFAVATPLLGKAAWQGLQLESGVAVDVSKARAESVLDVEPSAFTFDPVVVTVVTNSKGTKKTIEVEVRLKNNSKHDYYAYVTATLADADGKSMVSKSGKEKADEKHHAKFSFKFPLPSADAERVKRCKLQVAFEKH